MFGADACIDKPYLLRRRCRDGSELDIAGNRRVVDIDLDCEMGLIGWAEFLDPLEWIRECRIACRRF